MRVAVQEKLVVGYWELIPMESLADNSEQQYTSTVSKESEEPAENLKINLWWKEENCQRVNKLLERLGNPMVDRVSDEGGLGLDKDTVPRMTVVNF